MTKTSFNPKITPGLVGLAGRAICLASGALLLYFPYLYWEIATEAGQFNSARLTMFNIGIAFVQIVLSVMFFLPSMTEKYFQSGNTAARIIGIRLFLAAIFVLLVLEGVMIGYSEVLNLPEFMARLTEQELIIAGSVWVYFYLYLMVIPGGYLRFLHLGHMVKKLKFPLPVTMKYERRKLVVYIPDQLNNNKIETFELNWKDGLPSFSALNKVGMPLWKVMLGMPFVAIAVMALIGTIYGNFLANDALEAIYNQIFPFALAGVFAAVLLASMVGERKFALQVTTVGLFTGYMAVAGLQSVIFKGLPLIVGVLDFGPKTEEKIFQVLPQPSRFERIMASYCVSPLLVADLGEPGKQVYLCGLKLSGVVGLRAGGSFSLKGNQTEYGFLHSRNITVLRD